MSADNLGLAPHELVNLVDNDSKPVRLAANNLRQLEMTIDHEDFDIEVVEDENFISVKQTKRLCPQCSSAVTGRPNKVFCTSNCRKRHSEPTSNSVCSPTKRRENQELFDRALRLGEELYSIPPEQRLGFMKDLIDYARLGKDKKLQDILSNYKLLHPHPYYDTHLFPKRSRSYCTIAQATSNYCKRFWRKDVRLVVYNKVDYPYDGDVE